MIGISGSAVLVGLALLYRRQSDWHKRLMLSSLFTLTGPGTGRIAIAAGFAPQLTTVGMVVTELLLAVSIFYDWQTNRRIHPAYWIAAAVIVATHVGVVWAYSSPTWLAFARAIT